MTDPIAPDPLGWIDEEADDRARKGLERRPSALGASTPGRVVDLDGRPLLNFASNDYLGLASDPRVVEAANRAALQYGWGSGASPLVSGWREPHQALCSALARFEGVEAVTLFPSGFAANLGAIVALASAGDAVYSDRLNHASLIDGVRLSGASLRVYPHGDVDRLRSTLRRDSGRFRRSIIATDSVFSMDGDLAPLLDLARLAEDHGAALLVDEAHGTGVFGPTGRGGAEALGVDPGRIAVKVGTLSKALGSVGGFVAGSHRLIRRLQNHARTLIYSTAPPAAAAAAALRALSIVEDEPDRRSHLFALASRLRRRVADRPDLGVDLTLAGPIVPVVVGESGRAVALARHLDELGCLVPAIRPPTVPAGSARLRVSLTAAHTSDDVDRLAEALRSGVAK